MNDFLANGISNDAKVEILQPHNKIDADQSAKLVVFVPKTHVAQLRKELSKVGAGVIGNYSECSFESIGVGNFVKSYRLLIFLYLILSQQK